MFFFFSAADDPPTRGRRTKADALIRFKRIVHRAEPACANPSSSLRASPTRVPSSPFSIIFLDNTDVFRIELAKEEKDEGRLGFVVVAWLRGGVCTPSSKATSAPVGLFLTVIFSPLNTTAH
ncbi:hypothetical protein MSAN_01069300 [Mycena sanguinolenta]|uniref:Uncharacterized protein n=1 Tax=Mycena sanguinolenta TaxID=230812 RepID=A0A8H6YQ19_9AGAR|nr:hypothetical protein MSAN_01069300 [Mycena sanguinolenta]